MNSYCEYTEVACVYERLGCGVRMLRKDRGAHENEAREEFQLVYGYSYELSVQFEALSGTITTLHAAKVTFKKSCFFNIGISVI